MKPQHLRALAALFWMALLGAACAPPWHGEEDNYPIVALAFEDTLSHTRLHWADLGVTGLENLEHHRDLPIGNAFAQPGMNFDSRLNEAEFLLLPLDKVDSVQTFVLHHTNGTDTLQFQTFIDFGVDEQGHWDRTLYVNLIHHTFPAIGGYSDDVEFDGSPEYSHPQIKQWIWVAL